MANIFPPGLDAYVQAGELRRRNSLLDMQQQAGAVDLVNKLNMSPLQMELLRAQVAEHAAKAAGIKRRDEFLRPGNLMQFMQPGSPARAAIAEPPIEAGGGPGYPARPATAPTMDYKGLLAAAAAAGVVDPLAFAKEQVAENKPIFAPSRSPGYFKGDRFVPTPENMPAPPESLVAKLLREKASLPPGDPRHAIYDTAITHATNPQAQRIIIPPPAPAPHERLVQDTSSPTGWSWKDSRTGVVTKGAPPPAASARTEERKEQRDAAADFAESLVTRLETLSTANPRSGSGLAAGMTRALEATVNTAFPGAIGSQATIIKQTKEQLISVLGQIRGGGLGRLSNQDMRRVDTAIGAINSGTQEGLQQGLTDTKDLIDTLRGKPARSLFGKTTTGATVSNW